MTLLMETAQFWLSCSMPWMAFAVGSTSPQGGQDVPVPRAGAQRAEGAARSRQARQHLPALLWASCALPCVGVFLHTCGSVHKYVGVGCVHVGALEPAVPLPQPSSVMPGS